MKFESFFYVEALVPIFASPVTGPIGPGKGVDVSVPTEDFCF